MGRKKNVLSKAAQQRGTKPLSPTLQDEVERLTSFHQPRQAMVLPLSSERMLALGWIDLMLGKKERNEA